MKKYFLTGLAIFLPLAITIAIVVFLVNLLTKPFVGITSDILAHIHWPFSPEKFIHYGSKILALIFIVLVILVLGLFGRWFLFRAFLNLSNFLLHRIPIVNKVYKTIQDMLKTLLSSDKKSLQQVVMVPFPYPDCYSIGFLSRESPETCSETVNSELISVFVPTTPNPTTGFLMLFKKEDLIYLDMKTEDAVKFIVSCGVITPEQKEAT